MSKTSVAHDDQRTRGTIDVVAGWLGLVRRLGPGDLAELRRLDPERPSAPGFWRLVASMACAEGDATWRTENERRYAVILRTFAELRDVHRHGRRLGTALAEAQLDERRLLQLLRARKAALAHAIRTTCHFLTSKGVTVDAMDLARLVLTEDRPREDAERRQLARDYFRAAARIAS